MDVSRGGRADVESHEDSSARRVLLEEARTAANRQLLQLDKLDDAAVRTVRLAFILAGILAGGSRLASFPELGVLGAIGTWSLVASLLSSLYVYGTSRLFVGSGPDELDVDYEESASVKNARIEVIARYETGIRQNWETLYANGIVLAVSRTLLALAIVFAILGLANTV